MKARVHQLHEILSVDEDGATILLTLQLMVTQT